MARMRVFYEDWQMECCGTPFAVGDEVGWRLVAVAPDTHRDEYHGAGAWVENHGGPDQETTGRVHAVDLVHQEYLAYTDQRVLERIDRARAPVDTEPGGVEAQGVEAGKPIILPSPYRMEQVPGAWTLQSVESCPEWFETEEPGRGPGPHRIRRTKGALVTLDVTGTSPIPPKTPDTDPKAPAPDSGPPAPGPQTPGAEAPVPGAEAPVRGPEAPVRGPEGFGAAPGEPGDRR
jgi:hypothetical protein